VSSVPFDGAPRVEEVAGGVFAAIPPAGGWLRSNTGFIRGRTDVVAIDTCATEDTTRAFLAAVARTTDRPVRTLVNTHHHGEHTNGNALLAEATIIGHERCRTAILQRSGGLGGVLFDDVDWGSLVPVAPAVTFRHRLDVFVDDRRIELIQLASAAHTTDDIVAWLPEEGVLFSGDLVLNGSTPFVLMGSVAGSLEALDCIAELEPEVIVPGHGPPCTMTAVDQCGRYLRWLQYQAPELRGAGLTPLEAARQLDLGEFADLAFDVRIVANLHRAYAECAGVRPGEAIDITAALHDMAALNGGAPLAAFE
jgi:cyclase